MDVLRMLTWPLEPLVEKPPLPPHSPRRPSSQYLRTWGMKKNFEHFDFIFLVFRKDRKM